MLGPLIVSSGSAAGGASLFAKALPSAISAIGSIFGARKRNKAQIAMAREQMAFQERMDNTKHQREVKDLMAAGLNPILSATKGSVASAPSGAMASIEDEGSGAISSAKEVARLTQEIKNLKAQEEKTDAEKAEAIQRTRTSAKQAEMIQTQEDMLKTDMPMKKVDEAFYKSPAGKAARIIERSMNSVRPGAQSVRDLRRRRR